MSARCVGAATAEVCEPLLDAMEAEAGGDRVRADEAEVDVEGVFEALVDGCRTHGLDPEPYLRDLLCLLPEWSHERLVALAPAHWRRTVAEEPARGMLERHVLRRAVVEAEGE